MNIKAIGCIFLLFIVLHTFAPVIVSFSHSNTVALLESSPDDIAEDVEFHDALYYPVSTYLLPSYDNNLSRVAHFLLVEVDNPLKEVKYPPPRA